MKEAGVCIRVPDHDGEGNCEAREYSREGGENDGLQPPGAPGCFPIGNNLLCEQLLSFFIDWFGADLNLSGSALLLGRVVLRTFCDLADMFISFPSAVATIINVYGLRRGGRGGVLGANADFSHILAGM